MYYVLIFLSNALMRGVSEKSENLNQIRF